MTDQSVQEAVNWMVALQENPNDDRLAAAFTNWLKESEENRRQWGILERSRAMAAVIVDDQSAETTSVDDTATHSSADKRSASLARGVWAGLAIAAALALYVYAPILSLMLTADHLSPVGRTSQVTLQDGSRILLGARSAIAVEYTKDKRKVSLLAGEAFFDVQPDAARPFIVSAAELSARAIGTSFEVRRRSSGGSVAVASGKVEVAHSMVLDPVNSGAHKVQLNAGQLIRTDVSSRRRVTPREIVPDRIARWRSGRLVVEDWSLRDVLDVLDRHYAGTILRAGFNINSIRVTGAYSLERPIDSLRLIASSNGLRVRTLAGGLAILSRY
ncbi:MAG: FecR domain-containing protein [Pseudomonadota bacterium]